MSKVLVIDTNKRPQNPIHSAQARQLLRNGKAAIYRKFPFTIILKESRSDTSVELLKIKVDPAFYELSDRIKANAKPLESEEELIQIIQRSRQRQQPQE